MVRRFKLGVLLFLGVWAVSTVYLHFDSKKLGSQTAQLLCIEPEFLTIAQELKQYGFGVSLPAHYGGGLPELSGRDVPALKEALDRFCGLLYDAGDMLGYSERHVLSMVGPGRRAMWKDVVVPEILAKCPEPWTAVDVQVMSASLYYCGLVSESGAKLW